MPTALLAPNTTALSCTEFPVTADAPVTVSLFDADGHALHNAAEVLIELKASNGTWTKIGTLTEQNPVDMIAATGTWRVTRLATGANVGVDRS